jgi:hypothetical protein
VHDVSHAAKGVYGFIEVFWEAVVLIIVAKGSLVFVVPHGELAVRLSYIRLTAIGAGDFVCARL